MKSGPFDAKPTRGPRHISIGVLTNLGTVAKIARQKTPPQLATASPVGSTFRSSRDVRLESVMCSKPDVGESNAPASSSQDSRFIRLIAKALGRIASRSRRPRTGDRRAAFSLRHPLQTYVAHAVAANSLGCRRCQIDFAARPKPAVRPLICHRTDHRFPVGNIGHAKPPANLFKHVRTDQVPIGMQPFAVSRDRVIKLCGDAAVWRRLDTRKPEIVECFFSAGAQACCE